MHYKFQIPITPKAQLPNLMCSLYEKMEGSITVSAHEDRWNCTVEADVSSRLWKTIKNIIHGHFRQRKVELVFVAEA